MEYGQNLHKSLDDLRMQDNGGKSHAAASYRRYFEGYTESVTRDAFGKEKVVRKYTDPYHVYSGSDRQWSVKKLMLAGVLAVAICMLIMGAGNTFMGHGSRSSAAGECICVIGLAWFAISVVNCLAAPRRMTHYEYRISFVSLKRSSIAGAAGFAAAALASGLGAFLYRDGAAPAAGIKTVLIYLAAAALMLLVFQKEKTAVFVNAENRQLLKEQTLPWENGHE